jgi:hypothetical protein
MPYQVANKTNGNSGAGPRVEFSMEREAAFLVVGAYDDVNNIESGDRPLVIHVTGGLKITGLKTAPAGGTKDLVVDREGNVYVQG